MSYLNPATAPHVELAILNALGSPEVLTRVDFLQCEVAARLEGLTKQTIGRRLKEMVSEDWIEPAFTSGEKLAGYRITQNGVKTRRKIRRKLKQECQQGVASDVPDCNNAESKGGEPGCSQHPGHLSSTDSSFRRRSAPMSVLKLDQILDGLDLVLLSELVDYQDRTVAQLLATCHEQRNWLEIGRCSIDKRLKRLLKEKLVATKKIDARRVSYRITEHGMKARRNTLDFYRSV